jgi:hypothetical protein
VRHLMAFEFVVEFWIQFLIVPLFVMAEPARPVCAFADWVGTLFVTGTLVVFASIQVLLG